MFPKINKKRKSRNILIIAAAFFLLFAFVSVHSVHALSFPAGITNYVALNISNSQSTATPNPFQQMINVTSSNSGWTYINDTGNHFGQNVEFFYANGTIIPSWLENYTSTHALWWVKVGSIAASSKLTIYMGFAGKTTNLFNNKTTGEAPQLSSTYAEYDDGANVFNLYDNFAGTSLNTSKWTASANTAVTVDNGLKMVNGLGDSYADPGIFYNENMYGLDYVAEIYVPSIETEGGLEITNANTLQNDLQTLALFLTSSTPTTSYTYRYQNPSGTFNSPTFTATINNNSIFSNYVNGASGFAQINYGATSTTETDYNPTTQYIEIGSGHGTIYVTWFRTRAYPPNGVMPSVTFGSVQPTVAITLYLNGVSNANVTITYGTESNFTAVMSQSTTYVSLYVNGTKVASLTQGKAVYLKILAAGLYKVTAATNTSGVSNQTYYEKINKASDYLSLSSSPNINYTYNGTKANITAKVLSDLNNQLKNITFKVNNMTIKDRALTTLHR